MRESGLRRSCDRLECFRLTARLGCVEGGGGNKGARVTCECFMAETDTHVTASELVKSSSLYFEFVLTAVYTQKMDPFHAVNKFIVKLHKTSLNILNVVFLYHSLRASYVFIFKKTEKREPKQCKKHALHRIFKELKENINIFNF